MQHVRATLEDGMAETHADAIYGQISYTLAPIIRRTVHPETTYIGDGPYSYSTRGTDIGLKNAARPEYVKKYGKPPLKPRERLSARLELMLALTRMKNQLAKEILADTESIADAKAHKAEYNLEALR